MTALHALDAVSLISQYQEGETSPVDVLAETKIRIDRYQSSINAYSCLSEGLFEEARMSEQRWSDNKPIGALDGVPIIVKDNMAVRGMPASWGNAELARRPVTKDELPVELLRKAGALILGKANTPEFAVEGYTANKHFGVTTNPYQVALTPGGSSGAVAAAVASGQATLGIGTDGGGSIRRPAAYCGLIGLKPGLGRYPRANGLPQVLLDFEVVGPLTRTVRDSRLMDQVLRCSSRLDPLSRRIPAERDKPSRPAKVLYVPRINSEPCDPVVLAEVSRYVDTMANHGYDVTEGALPLDLSEMTQNWKSIAELGLSQLFENDEPLFLSASELYRSMAASGKKVTAAQLWKVLDTIKLLRQRASQLFQDWDLVVTPATASMPWNAESSHPPIIDDVEVGPRGHAIYSGWVNAIGHPSIAFPLQGTQDGVPIGVQLVGDLGAESYLLDIAEECESWRGGFKWPKDYS